VVCGGHFGPAEDARWEGAGRCLFSASADQTTRVHAPWRTDGRQFLYFFNRQQRLDGVLEGFVIIGSVFAVLVFSQKSQVLLQFSKLRFLFICHILKFIFRFVGIDLTE
jgi:hypothetical protein